MNHGADEKIAAQLDGMRLPGLFADHGDSSRERLEQRARTVSALSAPAATHPKPTLVGYIWTAEHRRRDKIDYPGLHIPR